MDGVNNSVFALCIGLPIYLLEIIVKEEIPMPNDTVMIVERARGLMAGIALSASLRRLHLTLIY